MAHNGFTFDFPILFAEVERRSETLDISVFEKHHIHFGDTLPLLKKVNNNSNDTTIAIIK